MRYMFGQYCITPEVNANTRWNVLKTMVTEEGKHVGKEYDTPIAYGVTLERAIEIVADRLTLDGEPNTLRDYIVDLRRVQKEIQATLQNV